VLKRIKKLLKGHPTIIEASRDTVDIYQPIHVPLLETIPILDWMCEMMPWLIKSNTQESVKRLDPHR